MSYPVLIAAEKTSAWAMLLPIGILLLMVIGMYWLSRIARNRLGMGAGTLPPTALKIVGKRMLEPRKSLYVVELAGRYVLVGSAENSITMLDRITPDEFAAMACVDDESDEGEAPRTALRNGLLRLVNARGASAPIDSDAAEIESVFDEESDVPAPVREQRMATVGEGFTHLLSKARSRNSGSDS